MGLPVPTIFNSDVELAARVRTSATQIADQPATTAPAVNPSVALILTTLITDHNALVQAYNTLRTDYNSMVVKLNALLAVNRTGGGIAP